MLYMVLRRTVFILGTLIVAVYIQTEMTGHEARINNVMDDGRKMIDDGTKLTVAFEIGLLGCPFTRALTTVTPIFLKTDLFYLFVRSFQKR